MFHREDAAEAATFLRVGQLHDLRAFDICQQGARLTVNAHPAREMAGWVVGEYPVPLCAQVSDAKIVHKIFREFKDPIAQCLRARKPDRVIREEFGIIVLYHVRAGTGRHHDVAGCFFEHADGMFSDGTGFGAQACVEGWLSATGLVGREVHVNAESAENVHDRLTSLRVERIDETGHKELNMSHESIVIPKQSHC